VRLAVHVNGGSTCVWKVCRKVPATRLRVSDNISIALDPPTPSVRTDLEVGRIKNHPKRPTVPPARSHSALVEGRALGRQSRT
jgi:hypothetical protein